MSQKFNPDDDVGPIDVALVRRTLGGAGHTINDADAARLLHHIWVLADLVVDEFEERRGRGLDERLDRPRRRKPSRQKNHNGNGG